MSVSVNYYSLLNINNYSDANTIKNAYKLLLKKCHPDKGGKTENFITIKEAYDYLINPLNKRELDNILSNEEEVINKSTLLEDDEYSIISDLNNKSKSYVVFVCIQCFTENKLLLNNLIYLFNNKINTFNKNLYLLDCEGCSLKFKILI